MEVQLCSSSSSSSSVQTFLACWVPSKRATFLKWEPNEGAIFHRHTCLPPPGVLWTGGYKRVATFCARAKSKGNNNKPSVLDYNEEDYPDPDEPLTEEEARRKNWVERGWAPWEEILSAEAQFAIDSLGKGKKNPELLRKSFHKLTAKVDKAEESTTAQEKNSTSVEEKHEEETEEESAPQVFSLIPPRDWPPPGWKVDPTELAFIREALSLEDVRIKFQDLEKAKPLDHTPSLARWNMFLKQYHEWVAANKDFLDKEAEESEEEYYPGRRKSGKLYREGMFELPFVYPGQHYVGVVTCVHLYEGAFVNYGGVHDGWVPIRDNDWYYIRHHIKVGMVVQVEVLAKRDPYRFRFPVEMRFVNPNIDHLIFRRFKYPPVFIATDETNWDELSRETGRPYVPRRRPEVDKEELIISHHPYSPQVLKLHLAEQAVLDREDGSDIVYDSDGTLLEDLSAFDTKERDPNLTFWIDEKCEVGDAVIPKIVMIQDEKELDLDAARVEREAIGKMWEEAEAKGEEFIIPKLKRELQMEELDEMHKKRIIEEFEALQRDKSCRIEIGLPLEEPGRYADASFFGKNPYNPKERRWRSDYFSDPTRFKQDAKKDKESRQRSAVTTEEETEKERPKGVVNNDVTNQNPTNNAKTNNELRNNLGNRQVVNGMKVADFKGRVDSVDDDWGDGTPDESQ